MRTASRSSLILSMLLLTVPAAGQTPQQDTPEPPPNIAEPPAGDINEPRAESEAILLSGCLQRGPDGEGFVLTRTADIDIGEPGAPGRRGGHSATPTSPRPVPGQETAGEPSARAERSALSTYRLVPAAAAVKLAEHVEHHVEVQGRLQVSPSDLTTSGTRSGGPPAERPGSTQAPGADSPTTTPGDSPPVQEILTTVEVTSLRMIAGSCEEIVRD